MPIRWFIALAILAATVAAGSTHAQPRQGTYLATSYFAHLAKGSPTAAAAGVEGPTALEIRPRRDGTGLEAVAVLGWHEGFTVALSPDITSEPCSCGSRTTMPIDWELTGDIDGDHLTIRNRQDGARYTFRWAGPVAEIAVAFHAIGGTWRDAQGNAWTFTESGEWHTPAAAYRYRLLLDHFLYDEDIIEVAGDPAHTSIPRTEDGKHYLIFEVPRPGTLVLRRLHHTRQDVFFPYDPGEVWRILRR